MSVKNIIGINLTNQELKNRVFKPIASDARILFISRDTKASMMRYVEDEKNQQKIATTLWKELLIDAICVLKMNDTREQLYQDVMKTVKQVSFARRFNKVRRISSYGIDALSRYFDDFVEYESVLYGADKHYRDHVQHPLQVWAIGVGILFPRINEFGFGLDYSRFHFQRKLALDETSNNNLSKSEILSMWTLIALTHDLGYPIERTSRINHKARKIVEHFGCLNFEELNYNFGVFNGIIVEKFLNIVSSKISNKRTVVQSKYRDKLSKSLEEFKHGIFSSLLLFKSLTYFLETDYYYECSELSEEDLRQFHIRKEVLRAIAGHTCPKLYHVSLNTLHFLLILCDEVQVWERPRFDDLQTGIDSEHASVTIKRCDITKSSQEIEIKFEYKKEENKRILDNFIFLHQLLRSAKEDHLRKMKLHWEVQFNGNVNYELIFDSCEKPFRQVRLLRKNKEIPLYPKILETQRN